MILAAQSGNVLPLADWVQFAVNLGAFAVVVALGIRGLLWFKPSVDRLKQDLDAALNKLEERDRFDRDVVIPTITQNNILYKETTEVVKEALIVIRELTDRRPPPRSRG